MTKDRALALVESPAQLLNVLELGAGEAEWASVRIAVLAPAEGHTRTQLQAMVDLAREAGHPVAWHEPRLGGAAVVRSVGALAGELSGVGHLVIGDPFSGIMQVIISMVRPTKVMLVDDGTATLEFARQWVNGDQLARWHQVATPSRRRHIATLVREQLAGTVRRRLSPESGCALGLFTSLPVSMPQLDVRRNDYAWVRASYPSPTIKLGADLIGTSLVESGVVDEGSYLTGVAGLAKQHGVDRYLAHRKESDAKLALIELMGIEVFRPLLPLEIVARRGPVGRTMISFPSTVVHTLPIVLQDTGVSIKVCEIEEGWFTEQATPRADQFLEQVTRTAQLRYGLHAVAS